MALANINTKIISYNIRSFGEDKYITVNNLLHKCDFLLLQETWKFDFDFINTIKKEFQGLVELALYSNLT